MLFRCLHARQRRSERGRIHRERRRAGREHRGKRPFALLLPQTDAACRTEPPHPPPSSFNTARHAQAGHRYRRPVRLALPPMLHLGPYLPPMLAHAYPQPVATAPASTPPTSSGISPPRPPTTHPLPTAAGSRPRPLGSVLPPSSMRARTRRGMAMQTQQSPPSTRWVRGRR